MCPKGKSLLKTGLSSASLLSCPMVKGDTADVVVVLSLCPGERADKQSCGEEFPVNQ
jgi:hypothetical protein